MGTNYYAVLPETMDTCPHCSQPFRYSPKMHIGKASGGWCFSLHVGSEAEPDVPKNLAEWQELWKRAVHIEDEYGDTYTIEEMLKFILERTWPAKEKDEWWFSVNHAIPGPNNLARHKIGWGCIGYGDGPYDLITGTFS